MAPDLSHRSDRTRFESLWADCYADVLAYAARRLGDEAAARDATAETFLVAWRRFDDVPVEARPWLFGVARKVIANARRGDRRRDALVARIAAEPRNTAGEPEGERLAQVAAAFNRLTEADREILSLTAWEELKPREAAPVLGITTALFSVRLHRAKQRLRKELERGGHEPSAERNPNEASEAGPAASAVQVETR